MKLIYQWIIVIVMSLVVYSLHIYGGTICSQPKQTTVAKATTTLVQVNQKPLTAIKYTIPKKRKRKHKARRIDIKMCKDMAEHIKWSTDDPDWYFCEASPKEETLKSNMNL